MQADATRAAPAGSPRLRPRRPAYAPPWRARLGDRILVREGGGLHAAIVIHTKLYAPGAHPADCPIPAGLTARRITTTHGVCWHALAPPDPTDKERNR